MLSSYFRSNCALRNFNDKCGDISENIFLLKINPQILLKNLSKNVLFFH